MNSTISPFYHSHSVLRGVVFIAALLLAACASGPQGETANDTPSESYVPPDWAPPYDNVSEIRYYYMPDYEMYYDVWDGSFWYQNGGGWAAYPGLPSQFVGADLGATFIVLIDRDISRPWEHHGYYRDNYPHHSYDHYRDIVVQNRVVRDIAPGHELVPRAFNENNNKVTFMQHPIQNIAPSAVASPSGIPAQRTLEPRPTEMQQRAMDMHQNAGATPQRAPQNAQQAPQSTVQSRPNQTTYNRTVHQVPMHAIAPSMPPASQSFNYGRGYTKPAK